MATMPGLPMFGHGQVEGFEEKYGMEYRRAYKDETADHELVARHEREIFPLLKERRLFSDSAAFTLYDLRDGENHVNENVFAYSNRSGDERALVLYNNTFQRTSGWIRKSAVAGLSGKARSAPDSLGAAMGASSNEKHFLLFREQRSDLWFIRPSTEIVERGLFVSLDGYQAQVFLDLHEIEDASHGRWRRLCDELGGRGVPDLRVAFQDLFLRDLYAAFLELAKPAYFNALHDQFAPDPQSATRARSIAPKFMPFLESLREPTLRFIGIALEYLDGADGRYDSFDRDKDYEIVSPESIWESFAQVLQRLTRLPEYAKKKPAAFDANAKAFIAEAVKTMQAEPSIASYLGGYAVLSLLRPIIGSEATGEDARRLVDHWCLDRKLRESYQEAGMDADEAFRLVNLLKIALTKTTPKTAMPVKAELSVELALSAFQVFDSRAFLGVNLYEDIAWFNKERFDEALLYGSLIAAIEGDAAFKTPEPSQKAPISEPSKGVSSVQLTTEKKPKEKVVRTGAAVPHPSLIDTEGWADRLSAIQAIYANFREAEALSQFQVDMFIANLIKMNQK